MAGGAFLVYFRQEIYSAECCLVSAQGSHVLLKIRPGGWLICLRAPTSWLRASNLLTHTLLPFFYSSPGEGGHQRRVPGRPLREPGVSIWHRIAAAGRAAQRCLHGRAEKLDSDDRPLLGGAAARPLDPPGESQALPHLSVYFCWFIFPAAAAAALE